MFRYVVLVCLLFATDFADAADPTTDSEPLHPASRYEPRPDGIPSQWVGSAVSSTKAAGDSVYIYGGPGTLEGRFETVDLAPDWQGWTPVDRTQDPSFWHVSTFNAANFTGPVGNHALWCGVEADSPIRYETAPGYGDQWDQRVLFERTADPAVAHEVRLQFEFHYDLEPCCDFFTVEYDSAGQWKTLAAFAGTNDDGSGTFPTPAIFDQTVSLGPGDYSGPQMDQIRLRLRVVSDLFYSDEDGLFDSVAGAAQVDNVVVTIDGSVVSSADFEGGIDDADWVAQRPPFAGDFAKVVPALDDLDACRSNELDPAVIFVDDGTSPSNAPGRSTGGATSATWDYGYRGYVVNGQGGLSFGQYGIWNEIWSPEIEWDDPTTTQDDDLYATILEFDVYSHLPPDNGIVWMWHVRSKQQGSPWGPWRDRGFGYWSDRAFPEWQSREHDVSDLVGSNPEKIQVALGVADWSDLFAVFSGLDATPSPYFDDVRVLRKAAGGPRLTIDRHPYHDGFATSGASDFAAERSQMSVRIDTSYGAYDGAASDDSLLVRAVSLIPEVGLAGPPTLSYRLFANPAFDDLRVVPPSAQAVGVVDGYAVYEGTLTGTPWPDPTSWDGETFGMDIPGDGPGRLGLPFSEADEAAFFWPGDWIHYYVEVSDGLGNVSRLPGELSGFDRPGAYDRRFTIRGLPSFDAQGDQPPLLVISDRSFVHVFPSVLAALEQNGLVEGVDFDLYASSGGQIHRDNVRGANLDQLADYEIILYLRNFSDPGATDLFRQWHGLAGNRSMIYFSDDLITDMYLDGDLGYVVDVMGVNPLATDAQPFIGNQGTVAVAPTGAPPTSELFSADFVAYGQCPYLEVADFDFVLPRSPAVSAFEFLGPGGESGLYDPSAGIWHERFESVLGTDYRRTDVFFPYVFDGVVDPRAKAPSGSTARAVLLGQVLQALGGPVNDGAATGNEPAAARLAVDQNLPNPFNPTTTIRFELPRAGRAELAVYDLAGRHVATLVEADLEAGAHDAIWNGKDDRGRRVGSGVYLYRLVTPEGSLTRRMVLLK